MWAGLIQILCSISIFEDQAISETYFQVIEYAGKHLAPFLEVLLMPSTRPTHAQFLTLHHANLDIRLLAYLLLSSVRA